MDSLPQSSASAEADAPQMSKNQMKKMKRDQEWEASRSKRKAKRKEKMQEKKQRKRAANEKSVEAAASHTSELKPAPEIGLENDHKDSKKRKRPQHVRVPITLVLDCGLDNLMMDKEMKSLGSQVTRCYSDNHKAPFQAHLAVSSFGGQLKERFDGLLVGQYRSWRNVRFLETDFMDTAEQAKGWMEGVDGGQLAGILAESNDQEQTSEEMMKNAEVVYLTSDSPDTLTELRPYSTYIIGGLVDRNRHKGVCYKRAMDRGMKTAKLPIGDYMQMTSRFVLATNHVIEIMLRWLELGDWGKAFLQVVPKRKGGMLKNQAGHTGEGEANGNAIEALGEESINREDVEPAENDFEDDPINRLEGNGVPPPSDENKGVPPDSEQVAAGCLVGDQTADGDVENDSDHDDGGGVEI